MDKDIPYIVYESEAARHERTVKRLVLALVLSVAMLFISNMMWLWFFNQFDIESETVQLDSSNNGTASYIGQDGVINNGGSEGQDN